MDTGEDRQREIDRLKHGASWVAEAAGEAGVEREEGK